MRALGYDSAREHQREAIRELVGGKDVFVWLPTGHGKSLCYAVLPLLTWQRVLDRPVCLPVGEPHGRPRSNFSFACV